MTETQGANHNHNGSRPRTWQCKWYSSVGDFALEEPSNWTWTALHCIVASVLLFWIMNWRDWFERCSEIQFWVWEMRNSTDWLIVVIIWFIAPHFKQHTRNLVTSLFRSSLPGLPSYQEHNSADIWGVRPRATRTAVNDIEPELRAWMCFWPPMVSRQALRWETFGKQYVGQRLKVAQICLAGVNS